MNDDLRLDLLAEDGSPEPNGDEAETAAEPLLTAGQLNLVDEIEATLPDEEARAVAQEWIGLPMFLEKEQLPRLSVGFDSVEDRAAFLRLIGVSTIMRTSGSTLSVKFPERPREDLASLRFVASWEDEQHDGKIP